MEMLKAELQRLKPMRSAGVATTQTTGGVARVARPSGAAGKRRDNVARWA